MAGVLEQWMRLYTDPDRRPAQARDAVRGAISTFEAVGDDYGLAEAWSLLGFANHVSARFADAETAWARAAVHARRAGERRDELDAFTWGLIGSWLGPTPVEAGFARADRLQADARLGLTHVLRSLGRSGPAERTLAEAIDLYRRKGAVAAIARAKAAAQFEPDTQGAVHQAD
jgi:hypothetical protein